ncbi:hypothetical protein [Hydrogenophaga sp.]|uniref:hypothetical protein n=1 Tax=Hydrogenophaga sp. TaxID=1904254 RepID=UPI003D103C69
MIKNLQDFLAGLVFLGMGIAAVWVASGHPVGAARDMGPGYVPLMLGLLLALLGALILFKALTFEALGQGRVARWGVGPMARVLAGLLWLAFCCGPAQWPWVGTWLSDWPVPGLVAGVAGLVLAVMRAGPVRPEGRGREWGWSLGLAALACAIWIGPLGLSVPLWPAWPPGH